MARSNSAATSFYIDTTVNSETMKTLFNTRNKELSDFRIKFANDTKEIWVQKCILRTAGEYFFTMLSHEFKEGNKNEVTLRDVDYDAFYQLLQFYYFPKVQVSLENVWEVIGLAKYFLLDKIENQCIQQISHILTSDNVCTCLHYALSYDFCDLINQCLKLISFDTNEILKTKDFLCCSKDTLQIILKANVTDCKEIDILNACLNWAKNACVKNGKNPHEMKDVKEEIGDCLKAIQFGAMKPEERKNCVEANKGLFEGEADPTTQFSKDITTEG